MKSPEEFLKKKGVSTCKKLKADGTGFQPELSAVPFVLAADAYHESKVPQGVLDGLRRLQFILCCPPILLTVEIFTLMQPEGFVRDPSAQRPDR